MIYYLSKGDKYNSMGVYPVSWCCLLVSNSSLNVCRVVMVSVRTFKYASFIFQLVKQYSQGSHSLHFVMLVFLCNKCPYKTSNKNEYRSPK